MNQWKEGGSYLAGTRRRRVIVVIHFPRDGSSRRCRRHGHLCPHPPRFVRRTEATVTKKKPADLTTRDFTDSRHFAKHSRREDEFQAAVDATVCMFYYLCIYVFWI